MRSDDFDYTSMARRVGLRGRLRALAGDNLMVMGMTIGLLLAAVPLGAFVVQVVAGDVSEFGWFCIGFLFPCGAWILGSGLFQAGKGGAVAAFARANDLELVQSSSATNYAGSLFADGSHLVRQSVRTGGETFVEVGERWPATAMKMRMSGVANTVRAEARTPELFLRVRLGGRVRPRSSVTEVIATALDEELRPFAGDYTVEATGRELTVFGSRKLEPTEPGRMRQALELAERLAEVADAELVGDGTPVATTSGLSIPEIGELRAPRGRLVGPLKVVGLTLALLIVVPLVIAAVMSVADDSLRGRSALAEVVVYLLVAVVGVVVVGLVRLITTPQRSRPVRTFVIVAVVILGTVAILAWAIANDDDSAPPVARERTPQAEATAAPSPQPMATTSTPAVPELACPKGDQLCVAWTATADWLQQHELVASDGLVPWKDCVKVGNGRRSCDVTVSCTGGDAAFSLLFDEPGRIVGARPVGAPEVPLSRTEPQVGRLVRQQCS